MVRASGLRPLVRTGLWKFDSGQLWSSWRCRAGTMPDWGQDNGALLCDDSLHRIESRSGRGERSFGYIRICPIVIQTPAVHLAVSRAARPRTDDNGKGHTYASLSRFRYPLASWFALLNRSVWPRSGYLPTPRAALGGNVSVSRMREARLGALTSTRRQCPTCGWTPNQGVLCSRGRRHLSFDGPEKALDEDDSTVFKDVFCPCVGALLSSQFAGPQWGEETKTSPSWQCDHTERLDLAWVPYPAA